MSDIGAPIAARGWRQGSIVPDADLPGLLAGAAFDPANGDIGIVVSQTCDLRHHDPLGEPYAELLLASPIGKADGNFTAGKHPRRLHLRIEQALGRPQAVELKPGGRHLIDRAHLTQCSPDGTRFLLDDEIRQLTHWLASRYVRPALPDAFNQLIQKLQKKRRGVHVRLSPHVSELRFQLTPERELRDDETYHLNLLALVPVTRRSSLPAVRDEMKHLAELMRGVGVDVECVALAEDKVPYSTVRQMRRFALEYLSIQGDPAHPMPADEG